MAKRCLHPYYERHHHWEGGRAGYLLEWCPHCGAKRVTNIRDMREVGFGQGRWLLPGSKKALELKRPKLRKAGR